MHEGRRLQAGASHRAVTHSVAMSDADSANPSDEIAVFQAYIDLINSERETIWARHNALLVANSLIIGALAISPAALWENKWAALAMIGAGLFISGAWLIITVQGWAVMRRHEDLVGAFAASCFKHLPNPFADAISNQAQTSIYRLVLLVVGIFVLMYLGLGYIRLAL
jgi:hypothetical protein